MDTKDKIHNLRARHKGIINNNDVSGNANSVINYTVYQSSLDPQYANLIRKNHQYRMLLEKALLIIETKDIQINILQNERRLRKKNR